MICLTYVNYIDLLTHQICGSRGVNVPPQQAASFHSQILSHSRCQRSEGDVGVGRWLFWWGLSFCLEAGGTAGSVWCRSSPLFPDWNPFIKCVFSGQIDSSSPIMSEIHMEQVQAKWKLARGLFAFPHHTCVFELLGHDEACIQTKCSGATNCCRVARNGSLS